MAQQRGTPAQQAQNARAAADMRSRMQAADERIVATQRRGKITAARSAQLRRQVAQTRQSMMRLTREQGFVSAAELASYDRTLRAIDSELSNNATTHSYGNDALPSAEVIAFQRADARLHYRNARIEHDGRGCAVYQGTAPNGQVKRVPLLDASNRPLCVK